jgi:hypothetical protein
MCERREVLFSSGGAGGEKLLDNDAGIPSLSAGTVDRLILRLLDSNYAHIDPTFANVFFMTHDYFVPAIELANRLIAMYARCAPPTSAAVRPDSWRVEVASRALLMLQFWLTSAAASHLLADDELLTLVRKFATPIAASSLVSVFDEDTQHALTYLAQLVGADGDAGARRTRSRCAARRSTTTAANASGGGGGGGGGGGRRAVPALPPRHWRDSTGDRPLDATAVQAVRRAAGRCNSRCA